MAADAVYDTIKAYLQDPVNVAVLADPITSVVPSFRFENEAFEKPNPPVPWIAMTLTGVLYGQQSMGASEQADNRWDEAGHLWFQIFAQTGSGSSRARQLAKQLADIFRGLTLLNGSLEFLDTFIGEGEPAPEEGNWYRLTTVIDWRRVEA